MDSGIVPTDWTRANITPLPKVPRSKSVNDLRPISLTSVVSKVFESIVWNHIIPFLLANQCIGKYQHGALPNRSTVTSLLESLNSWTKSFDDALGPGVDVLYVDFAKAFDTVPLKRLLVKLECVGIRGKLLKWFSCFLLHRKQRVLLNGHPSQWRGVSSGIPQGTITGPFAFLVYINDLPPSITEHSSLFVDDLKIDRPIYSVADCYSLQLALRDLESWCRDFLLTPKPEKCGVLRIRPKFDFTYSIGGSNLPTIRQTKDLGVIVSDDLKPNLHIDYIEKKANRTIGLIKRCVAARSAAVIVPLYKGLVRPILEYAAATWSPQYVGAIHRLEKIQRRCLRLAHDLDATSVSKLHERRETIDLINCYKIMNNLTVLSPGEFFSLPHRPLRGNDHKLAVHYRRTNIRGHFFSNRVVSRWNRLPSCVTGAPNLANFKRELRSLRHQP